MEKIYRRLTDNVKASYSLEDIKNYAEEFPSHWKIRVCFFFINKYPQYEKELLKMALDASIRSEIVLVSEQIIVKLQNIGDEIPGSILNKIDEINKKYTTMKCIQESSVRAARIIGIPESLRRYLYELALIYEAGGDYAKCKESLSEALTYTKEDHRPHCIFIKLAELYLLGDDKLSIRELCSLCKSDKWKNDKSRDQKNERVIIYFLHYLDGKNCANCISKLMARFDPTMFENTIISIPPAQLCKIFTIILLTSFTIKNLYSALRLFKTIPSSAEKQYHITPMIMSLVRGDFCSFNQYFNLLIPHIFNDIFLSSNAQDIIDLVIENVIINYLHQFSSVFYISMETIFHLPIETIEKILKERKLPPKYIVDVQRKVIFREDRESTLEVCKECEKVYDLSPSKRKNRSKTQ